MPSGSKHPVSSEISGDVVWITGASQGIGRSLALLMAERGMTVIASARSDSALKELAEQSAGLSGSIEPAVLDITNSSAVAQVVFEIVQKYGRIDQAILNAGTFLPMKGSEFTASVVQQQVDLNVMGTSYCLEPLIQQMKKQCSGIIAVNASLSGYRGLPQASAYGATKAALINMAEALHVELKDHGIDVKVINPGFVKTPLTDKNTFHMPFLISSEEASERIYKGLKQKGFEIRFPALFAFLMSLLRMLSYRIYFFLIKRTVD